MRLLDPSRYDHVFKALAGKRAWLAPDAGGYAEQLAILAAEELCRHFRVSLVEAVDQAEVVLLAGSGAGIAGTHSSPTEPTGGWGNTQQPVVILPHSGSIQPREESKAVFVTQRYSPASCPGAALAPDLSLYHDFPEPGMPQSPLGFFLRQDEEGLFREVPNQGDPLDVAHSLGDYVRLAAHFAHVVTDRVHFAIAALGQARHATLLPSRSPENRGVYDCWLQPLGCTWADSPYDCEQAAP